MKHTKISIQERASEILQQQGITQPPVPVEKIAKSLGALVRFSPLDQELSGMIYIKEERPIIGVNALHHPNRQRFTLAHEIGHLLLHRSVISKQVHVDKEIAMLMRDSNSATGLDEMEREANRFAAELLMPLPFILAILPGGSIDIDDEDKVEALARQFKVSAFAMRVRLADLSV